MNMRLSAAAAAYILHILPGNYIISDYGACVRTCNDNTYEVEVGGIRKCAKCDGLCPKGKKISCYCAIWTNISHRVQKTNCL